MVDLQDGLVQAFWLVVTLDAELLDIALRSLRITVSALIIASLIAMPLAALLASSPWILLAPNSNRHPCGTKRLSFSEFYQQVDIIGFHATMEMTAMDFNSETTAAEYLEPQAIKTFERPTQQQTEFDAAMDAAMAAMDFTSTTPDDFEPQAIEGAAFNKRQEPDNDEENDRAFYAAIKDAMQFMDLSQETDDLNPIDLGKA